MTHDASNADAELTRLCEACGLCCDGSLFGRVGLEPDEVESARRHRLTLVGEGDEASAFEQPCAALTTTASGRCCAAYDARPRACRGFECRLYARHRREGGPVGARIAVVARVRSLVEALEDAGVTAADFDVPHVDDATDDPRVARARILHLELIRTLEGDFSREP